MAVNLQPASKQSWRAACAANLVAFTPTGTSPINVAMVLKDAHGQAPLGPVAVAAYLSANADGSTITGTGGTVAVHTNGLLVSLVSGKVFQLVTNSAGLIDLDVTGTTITYYLVLIMPDGSLAISTALTFA